MRFKVGDGKTERYWNEIENTDVKPASELRPGESTWVSVVDFLKRYPGEEMTIARAFGQWGGNWVELTPYIIKEEWHKWAILISVL
ncbi:MAG: hypothetical protein WCV59_01930 [Parcubacteria group bacterium]|jgi:hypothetical protein